MTAVPPVNVPPVTIPPVSNPQPWKPPLVEMPQLETPAPSAGDVTVGLKVDTSNAEASLQKLAQLGVPAAEPGYTTTEFWVTATTEIIGLLASAGVIGSSLAEKLTGMAGMVVAGAFYAISRGLRKQGTAG